MEKFPNLNNNTNNNTTIRFISTDCSPSHLFNNLSINHNLNNLIFIHNSEVQPRIISIDLKLIEALGSEDIGKYINKLNNIETTEMLICKYININGVIYVAVGLYGGFKLFSNDGNRLLTQIPSKTKNKEKPYYFQAVTGYIFNDKTKAYSAVVCGDNYGQIFLVTGSGQSWRSKIIFSNDEIAVTSLSYEYVTNYICAGFENGEIIILKIKDDNLVELIAKYNGNSSLFPCLALTTLSTPRSICVAGFTNGEIKLFDLVTHEEIASIGAHLRIVNSLTSVMNLFVSSGDDCYVNVWKINEDNKIELIRNVEIKDQMPIGSEIIFNSDGKIDLLSVCYDFPHLVYLNTNI